MENKFITIIVKSDYDTTIIKKIDVDSNVDEMFTAFGECMLTLGYHPDNINEILNKE
jgi:hypothetical protein